MYKIIGRRKIWYVISLTALIPGFVFIFLGGIRPGIDFTGGSLLRLTFINARPPIQDIEHRVSQVTGSEAVAQHVGNSDIIIRSRELSTEERDKVIADLKTTFGPVEQKSFEQIGPTVGKELRTRAYTANAVVAVAIILYIAFAFRKVKSGPLRSWSYGVVAIVALVHDILFVIGAFAILGYFFHIEIGGLFVTALLTTLGFSVHDTIVVFDRIRERLLTSPAGTFEETVNQSINQTLTRSINTSFTTVLVLVSLYIFGGESIRTFVLALILGFITGTYSSIFVASPLLVTWDNLRGRFGRT